MRAKISFFLAIIGVVIIGFSTAGAQNQITFWTTEDEKDRLETQKEGPAARSTDRQPHRSPARSGVYRRAEHDGRGARALPQLGRVRPRPRGDACRHHMFLTREEGTRRFHRRAPGSLLSSTTYTEVPKEGLEPPRAEAH